MKTELTIIKTDNQYILVINKNINMVFDKWEPDINSGSIYLYNKETLVGFIQENKEQTEFIKIMTETELKELKNA